MNRVEIESIIKRYLEFINSPNKNPMDLDELLHKDFKLNLDFHGLEVDLIQSELDRENFIKLASTYGVPTTLAQNIIIDETNAETSGMWKGYFEEEGTEAWRLMYHFKFRDNKIIEYARIGDGSRAIQNDYAINILKRVVDQSIEMGKTRKIEDYIKTLRDEGLIKIDG